MSLDKNFLEDEVRLGFYIPSTIKQAWAAELKILSEIDRICKDNSISYFADWGTLLGAVRHGGFIPWDDDLDLVMLREDYDRFLKIAPSLLPEGYSIHTYRNEENFIEFHAVVINTEHARFDKEHYDKFYGFPYIAGIDIFVLDYIYEDEIKEKQRCNDITFIIAFADGMLDNRFNKDTIESNLSKIEQICHTTINRKLSTKELWINLYELAEAKCAEVSKEESDTLTQMVPWGLKGQISRRYPKSSYEQSILLPFENTFIPVPVCYDKLLTARYGNYMKLIKSGGAHDYPYFNKQKTDLEALLGNTINFYHFDTEMIKYSTAKATMAEWKTTLTECLKELDELYKGIISLNENITDYIADAQQISIDLGNFIESIKGVNHTSISFIESFCESLYSLYTFITGEDSTVYEDEILASQQKIDSMIEAYNSMVQTITSTVLQKQEIVFLPVKSDKWESFDPIYNQYLNNDKFDVYVVPIPYFYKEFDGSLSDEQYNLSSYPDSLNVIPYDDFSLEFHHPDIIVIGTPFDQYNAITSIHPDYYSSKIHNYTSNLIYVSWMNMEQIDISDTRSFINLDNYVTMPGLVYSSEIILSSETIKAEYLKKLTDWSGIEYFDYWDSKIRISDIISSSTVNHSRKTIMYYLGEGQPIQNESIFLEKFKKTMLEFKANNDKLSLLLVIPSGLLNNMKLYSPSIYAYFLEEISNLKNENWITITNSFSKEHISSCDAYYGDTSSLILDFQQQNKPVMIQNYYI